MTSERQSWSFSASGRRTSPFKWTPGGWYEHLGSFFSQSRFSSARQKFVTRSRIKIELGNIFQNIKKGSSNFEVSFQVPVSIPNSFSSVLKFGIDLYFSQNVSFDFWKISASRLFHSLILDFKSSLSRVFELILTRWRFPPIRRLLEGNTRKNSWKYFVFSANQSAHTWWRRIYR